MSAPPPPPAPSAPVAPAAAAAKPKSKWTVEMPAERDWKDIYPFHCAAQMGDAASLRSQLAAGGVIIDALDDDSWAALHYAAWYGHTEAVQVLLDAKASPNILNAAAATPLHFAAGAGRVDAVRALLKAGADRSIKSAEKQTPAQLAQQLQPDQHEIIASMLDASKTNWD